MTQNFRYRYSEYEAVFARMPGIWSYGPEPVKGNVRACNSTVDSPSKFGFTFGTGAKIWVSLSNNGCTAWGTGSYIFGSDYYHISYKNKKYFSPQRYGRAEKPVEEINFAHNPTVVRLVRVPKNLELQSQTRIMTFLTRSEQIQSFWKSDSNPPSNLYPGNRNLGLSITLRRNKRSNGELQLFFVCVKSQMMNFTVLLWLSVAYRP